MWDWRTYFIFGFSLLWAVVLLGEYGKKKRGWIWILMALLPLFFLQAFRAETVGTDLPRYAIHVEDGGWFVSNYGEPPLEILSQLLFYLSYELGGFHWFLFLSSLFEYIFLALAIRELRKRGVDVVIVFVLMFSYVVLRSVSMVRNGIALSATLCAFAQLFTKDKTATWKYWIYSLIALGFHNSAILNIPIYFICRPIDSSASKYQLRMALRVFAILVLGGALFYVGQSGILDLFFRVTGDMYNDTHFEQNQSWGIGNLIVRLPFLLIVIYSIPKMRKAGYEYLPFLLLLLFDIVVSQTKYISQDFERLTMYTGLSQVILWGMLSRVYIKKYGSIGKFIFIVVGIYYFTYYMHKYAILGADGAGNGLMPYHTWFSLF